MRSYDALYTEYQQITFFFILIAACFLLVTLIWSVAFTHRIRQPLKSLVMQYRSGTSDTVPEAHQDEVRSLNEMFREVEHDRLISIRYIKEDYMRGILLDQNLDDLLTPEMCAQFDHEIHSEYYCVMLLRLSLDKKGADAAPEDQSLREMRKKVSILLIEIFSRYMRCKVVDLGLALIAVLFMPTDAQPEDQIAQAYHALQRNLVDEAAFSLQASLGHIVYDKHEIHLSYEKAKQYMELGFYVNRAILLDANNLSLNHYHEKNVKLVDAIVEYTQQHYADADLSLKRIADHFSLSATYIGKIFKSIQGSSFSVYLSGLRLTYAREMLWKTNLSIQEISLALGFTTSTYFTTLFKKAFGITPSAYRNQQ